MKKVILKTVTVITLLLTGCLSGAGGSDSFFTTPTVSLQSITPKNIANGQVSFDLNLLVNNSNMIPLPISSFVSDISLNNIALLKANSTKSISIPANGSSVVSLNANIGQDSIMKLIRSISSSNINYSMTGNVGVGGLAKLPFNQSGTVDATELAKNAIQMYLK